jgi:hypothetical protein
MLRNFFSRIFSIDERFKMHRYASTRIAVTVGVIVAAAWIYYDYFFKDILQLELLIVMLVMAAVKIAAMVYFRLTH